MSEDIFNSNADNTSEWAMPVADAPDSGEAPFSLDLSEEAFGAEFSRIPIGQPLHCEVVDAEFKYSKSGNAMYVVSLRVLGDDWGKNRQFRQYIVVSKGDENGKGSTMFRAIPALSILGTPLRFEDGTALTSQKQARATVRELVAAGKSTRIVPPTPESMVGKTVWTKIDKHEDDHKGATDDNGNIKKWERIDGFLPDTHDLVTEYQGFVAGGGKAADFLASQESGEDSGPMYS